MITDQLRLSVYFYENYLFVLSKATKSDTTYDNKQWKLIHEQQILIWTVSYIITEYMYTQFV